LKDLLAANHLKANDILREGRHIHIPNGRKSSASTGTVRSIARIKGDRISVRTGPGSTHHRLRVCEDGTPLTVTGEQDGWLKVRFKDGKSGWVRSDFVRHRGNGAAGVAHKTPRRKSDSGAPLTPAALPGGRERLRAHRAAAGRDDRIARKHHEERHPLKETAAKMRQHSHESAAAKHKHHLEAAARAKHERHLMELAAAVRHAHAAKLAAMHHSEEVAKARHRKHLVEIAAKHHHKNSHELAKAEHQRRLHEKHLAQAEHQKRLHEKHLAEIAKAEHRKHLHAAEAKRSHHHKEELAHQHRLKRLQEIAAARHKHHLEALANAHHRHLAAVAAHERRAALAARRHHERGDYSHHIRPEAESPASSNDIVRAAYAYRGTPYRWGMSRPGGFDCSGFTKYVYGRKGVSLPRTAAEQYHAGHAVGHKGMKPGDLVFFHTTRSGISHVGMYVGSGKFVHSSSKKSGGVRVDSLDTGYYSKAFRGARRVRNVTNEPSGE
jgi:cell wall-associated NlpC family hydrolase/uncharacterized protein YraI